MRFKSDYTQFKAKCVIILSRPSPIAISINYKSRPCTVNAESYVTSFHATELTTLERFILYEVEFDFTLPFVNYVQY